MYMMSSSYTHPWREMRIWLHCRDDDNDNSDNVNDECDDHDDDNNNDGIKSIWLYNRDDDNSDKSYR